MTDHEALEALSKKATQGEWEIAAYYTGTGPDEQCHGLVEVEDFPIGIIDEEGATAESLSPNLEFIVALVNAYRTGQLIPAPSVDDAMVERVARALRRYALGNISNEERAKGLVDGMWESYVPAAQAVLSIVKGES